MRSDCKPATFHPRKTPDGPVDASSSLERAVARWAQRRLGSLRHERRVLALADALFDLLRPVHKLGPAARRALRLAALVHDVGRSVDDARHPEVGARLLLGDGRLPLTPRQRRRLAYLTRYHRGAVPKLGFDDVLTDADPRRQLRAILAILRAADALDGRQHHPPTISFKLRGGRNLKVRVALRDDTRRARKFFSRQKKFRLLEEELDVQVTVAVKAAPLVVD